MLEKAQSAGDLVLDKHLSFSLEESKCVVWERVNLIRFFFFPVQAQREDILRKIMIENTTISESSVNEIDLGSLSHKMQGYVARDLENVINRAIHAHILTQGRGK